MPGGVEVGSKEEEYKLKDELKHAAIKIALPFAMDLISLSLVMLAKADILASAVMIDGQFKDMPKSNNKKPKKRRKLEQ